MATVDAALVVLSYGDSPSGPFLDLICEQDSNFDGSRNVISEESKCGTLKGMGPANNKFSGTGIIDTNPGAGQASYNELLELYVNNSKKYWTLTNPANDIFMGGYGWVSNLGEQNPSSGVSKFSITIEIDGNIDTQPSS